MIFENGLQIRHTWRVPWPVPRACWRSRWPVPLVPAACPGRVPLVLAACLAGYRCPAPWSWLLALAGAARPDRGVASDPGADLMLVARAPLRAARRPTSGQAARPSVGDRY
jgi:hypothetical protein